MMADIMLLTATMIFIVRAAALRRLWSLPMKNGEGYFLAREVGPDFYREAGAALLRKYRVSVIVPLLLDLPLSAWLVLIERYDLLLVAQFISMLATIIVHNVIIAHFSYRAQLMAGREQEPRATTIQLSMAPRRLRDHTNRMVEVVILGSMLLALAMFARVYERLAHDYGGQPHNVRAGVFGTILIFYMQLGLLLLKVVFVRWRMPLPVRRTEDFRQWRAAWLSYHLRVFDASRVLLALLLLSGGLIKLTWGYWPRSSVVLACSIWIPAVSVFIVYVTRERRRLAAAEREFKPVEMVKEFPQLAIPQGRFLAGGLLYINRDNPVVLVRSPQGLAINLANPSAYVWAAYLIGLGLLMTLTLWMPG